MEEPIDDDFDEFIDSPVAVKPETAQTETAQPETTAAKEVMPETLEISEGAKQKVLQHVQPQESKYWHFTFIKPSNQEKLASVFESIPGYNLTATFSSLKKDADITLKQNETAVGKIHMLLCDRRNANLPSKYYIKLYLYQFKDAALYDAVKTKLVDFFENFTDVTGGQKRSNHRRVDYIRTKLQHRRITHRHMKRLRAKKTLRRR